MEYFPPKQLRVVPLEIFVGLVGMTFDLLVVTLHGQNILPQESDLLIYVYSRDVP